MPGDEQNHENNSGRLLRTVSLQLRYNSLVSSLATSLSKSKFFVTKGSSKSILSIVISTSSPLLSCTEYSVEDISLSSEFVDWLNSGISCPIK